MAHTQTKIKLNIVNARMTEKAALAHDKGCYVFNVSPDSTKSEIAKEIQQIYKVTPVKVNIAKAAAKKTMARGRAGTKSAVKKAYVFLKDGDKINVM